MMCFTKEIFCRIIFFKLIVTPLGIYVTFQFIIYSIARFLWGKLTANFLQSLKVNLPLRFHPVEQQRNLQPCRRGDWVRHARD